jgi:hypothetical protein
MFLEMNVTSLSAVYDIFYMILLSIYDKKRACLQMTRNINVAYKKVPAIDVFVLSEPCLLFCGVSFKYKSIPGPLM